MLSATERIDALLNSFTQIEQAYMDKLKNVEETKEDPAEGASRILLADKLGPFVMERLSKDCIVQCDPSLNGDTLAAAMKSFEPNVIVVRSTKVQQVHLDSTTHLALIVRAGAGTNTIDVQYASNKGIFVCNCPGKNAIAVAELVMGHLVNLDRRISDNVSQLRQGVWNKKEFSKARGLYGRTLAVLGVGQIGSEVCKRAVAFGMTVRGYSRSMTEERAQALGIVRCESIAECMDKADAVSIHIPMSAQTKHIVDRNVLSKLNDGAFIINTSRGGVLHEQDMLSMVKEKNFRCALDVYENEPKSSDKEFKDEGISQCPNVYGSHHIGASTEQAADAVGTEVLRVIRTFLNSGSAVNCVNLEKSSPARFTLTVRHNDVVGVLASVLSVLKSDKINVQEMSNTIFRGAKAACATLQVDNRPSNNALKEIQSNEEVYGVEVNQKH